MFTVLLSIALASETYIDIKDIPNTTDCVVIVNHNGDDYQKYIKDCKLKENEKNIELWFKKLIKK